MDTIKVIKECHDEQKGFVLLSTNKKTILVVKIKENGYEKFYSVKVFP